VSQTSTRPALSPWRFVVVFGVVAMLADVVYEGARSVAGPYLAALGASAALVGLVTGAGEAVALVLRLASGPAMDRLGHPWRWTIAGYALTAVSVPLLALGGPLWTACGLLIAERTGKAVRSPAKDALLASASTGLGRGRAFAVHEALDQTGAFAGPLAVAAALALSGGYRLGFAVLAVPAVLVLGLLSWLARRVPDPAAYEPRSPHLEQAPRLPRRFWAYAAFTALTMAGYPTFGVLGYHLAARGVLPVATIPLVYALAMAVDALAALATGPLYDRYGLRVLFVLPVLAGAVPALSFAGSLPAVLAGAAVWGAALGVQESTMRAAVAELVPAHRRGTGYGVFGAVYGMAWFIGGAGVGALYDRSIPLTLTVVVSAEVAALALLAAVVAGRRTPSRAPRPAGTVVGSGEGIDGDRGDTAGRGDGG
jgi:MFS family permease